MNSSNSSSIPSASPATANSPSVRFHFPGLGWQVTIGLIAGIGVGLFLGDVCQPLKRVADVFIGLLQMTILPYLSVSLISRIGRLQPSTGGRLIRSALMVMAILWALGLSIITLTPLALPDWKDGSFFNAGMIEAAPSVDLFAMFIPSNVFQSLASGTVPAVVVFCMAVGIALRYHSNKQSLLDAFDVLADTLIRINTFIIRLMPLGIFAMTAHTAGTLPFDDIARLHAYIVQYVGASLILTLAILPWLMVSLTPFSYREIMRVTWVPMVTAFATGKVLIVLPILTENTLKLFADHGMSDEQTASRIDVLYPTVYPFPQLGKLLSILFIPFVAWFLGSPLTLNQYPQLMTLGLVAFFGGPLLAMPFLLELMRLPSESFQLYLISGVICERTGEPLGVMHLTAICLITVCMTAGVLQVRAKRLITGGACLAVLLIVCLTGSRAGLGYAVSFMEKRIDVILRMHLLQDPVAAHVLERAEPNPQPLRPDQTRLRRIRERGVIRVGFKPDRLPYSFVNERGDLVGMDINLAHVLASDLQVELELVPIEHGAKIEALTNDHVDLVMTGVVGTLELLEKFPHAIDLMDVHMGLVVRDYRAGEFASIQQINRRPQLRIGFSADRRGLERIVRDHFPFAQLVKVAYDDVFFGEDVDQIDALFTTGPGGSAWTLVYPEYQFVIPQGGDFRLPMIYLIGDDEPELSAFIERWVTVKRDDGTIDELYDYWILGKVTRFRPRRWSVARDILRWNL